jgi:hypothetical protein
MRNGLPILAIAGMGRAGKDTASEWLRDNTVLRFGGGSSWSAAPYMGRILGKSAEEAYRDRHQDRMFWFNKLNELREKEGPTCLVKLCLEHSDIICGLRNRVELIGGRDEGLIDLIIWIENPRVDKDPTVEFTIDDADIVVRNNDTLDVFYKRLRNLAAALKILRN